MLEKRLKIKARRFLICLIIAAAAVVFVLLFSVVELKKTMDTESEKYLTETTSHACAFIDSKMDTTFLGLKSIYNTYF